MTSPAEPVVPCADLDEAIAHYVDKLGFRLDMIMPADSPRVAVVSRQGASLRLVAGAAESHPATVDNPQEFLIAHAATHPWALGRAGMHYRDLIPDRLGGRFIASHIRIENAGPVADYVHYHKIGFQMIYCRRGWVRVVYEDQGPPFVMHEGDCVLQPPEIRHRVLESSAGLEVIEIASPAEHETWRDHALDLPTAALRPERAFGGQRFVRHIAADAAWERIAEGIDARDTGIAQATGGLAGARVLRLAPKAADGPRAHDGEFSFLSILDGQLRLGGPTLGTHTLETDDSCVIPAGADHTIEAVTPSEVLEVALPARPQQSEPHITRA